MRVVDRESSVFFLRMKFYRENCDETGDCDRDPVENDCDPFSKNDRLLRNLNDPCVCVKSQKPFSVYHIFNHIVDRGIHETLQP